MKQNEILKKYHKQVRKAAVKMLNRIIQGDANFMTLMAPMQSGKTEFIACFYELVKILYPQCMGLYVTAHNHLDFIQQNFVRLEHLEPKDLYCLCLRERKLSKIKNRPLSNFPNQPLFVFFDESHFGDGAKQTINNWLAENRLYPAKRIFLIGISATPFSSYSICMEQNALVNFDPKDMSSYKSVSHMLKLKQIEESTPLIIKNESEEQSLDVKNKAFLCLKENIKKKEGGYAIIRTRTKEDACFLESELKQIFKKENIFIKHWNQGSPIVTPKEYFSNYKPGVFIVVFVQQKARLGSTIPTDHIKLVYEYSPNGSVATISQSLLGRCCGHNKLKHKLKIFTHLKQAEAYSLFEQGRYTDFAEFIDAHGLKASQRSVVNDEELEVVEGQIKVAKNASRNQIIDMVRSEIEEKHGSIKKFRPILRAWSRNEKEREFYKACIREGKNPAYGKESDEVGYVSIFHDDRKGSNEIYYSYRTDVVLMQKTVVGSAGSLFSNPENF